MGRHPQRAGEARAAQAQVGEGIRVRRRRAAETVQRIRQPAELVEDRVVRDGPQLGGMGDPRRPAHAIGLPRRRARSGAVQQPRPEGAEQRGIAGVLHQLRDLAADGGEEIGAEIGLGIDRVGLGGRRGEGVLGDARDRRGGELRRAEQQVAVAALEARLLPQPEAGLRQRGARLRRREI